MILLEEVSKSYWPQAGERVILSRTNMKIPTDRAVAVLGRNGAGKSTFLRLLAGVELPTRGRITRTVSLSWPMGLGTGVHRLMTGRQNAEFVARVFGMNPRYVCDFVEDFAELGAYLDEPVGNYSSGMKARLNFGMSLAVDFDCYLIDEATAVGDQWFRQKCVKAFADRRARSGLIMVSHNPRTIRQYCDIAIVLDGGRLLPFLDLDEAVHYYTYGSSDDD
jgi:capsular polysaccharide transport system ATP-binding protein